MGGFHLPQSLCLFGEKKNNGESKVLIGRDATSASQSRCDQLQRGNLAASQLVKLLPSPWLDASMWGNPGSQKKGREYTHVASNMVGFLVVSYTYVLMCSVLLLNCFLDIIHVDLCWLHDMYFSSHLRVIT